MAYELRMGMQKRPCVLQGDQLFFNRIISRNSSVGCSSRVYYYRSSEGIPFEWEMQPGTPKDPPKEEEEALPPPLSPPPAMISLGVPKPCVKIINQEPKTPSRSIIKLKFWRKSKKNKDRISSKENNGGGHDHECHKYYDKEEFCGSDREFMASPPPDSSSSSSSSSPTTSFSNGFHRESSSRMESQARDSFRRPLSCSPWNVCAIMVSIAKRV